MGNTRPAFGRRALITLAASLVVTALLVPPLTATPPAPVSGTILFAGAAPTSVREAGGNTIIVQDFTEVLSGTYTGTVAGTLTVTVHSDGLSNVRGEFSCSCTVAGQGAGTLLFRFEGTGAPDGTSGGQYEMVGASGGLANAHGHGTFFAPATGPGTYSGWQHYDP